MRARHPRIAAPLVMIVLATALAAPGVHAAPAAGTGRAAIGAATTGARSRIEPTDASTAAGKPVAAIALGYELSAQPALGVPFEVRIAARGGDGIADLALTVRAGPGLEVGTPQLTEDSADGAARSWTIAATAYGSGTLHLNLLVEGTAGTRHPARALAIPIRAGAEPAIDDSAPPRSTLGPATERVIVLPAARGR
jgi:hypothetical protein